MRRNHQPRTKFRAQVHENFPSQVWKCVGLLSIAPPIRIQFAIHSIISAGRTVGLPNKLSALLTSLSKALDPSLSETKVGSMPKWRPNSSASSFTESISGPVIFSTVGGDEQ